MNHGEKPLQNHRASLTALRHLDCAALVLGIHAPGHCQYLARLKSWTARNLIQYLAERNVKQILDQLAFYKKAHKGDRAYQFWQEGVHPELIQSDAMMWQKIDYIHQNPVKRGYVDEAAHWRYSSARDYMGASGLLAVCREW
ncbi:hypothetical protein [Salinivibrio sp. AR640]|uniref:hypothetical protein n=1 Tax=Salinivibrio sp. AR640 TaxID=1909437 RepID=UPI0018FE90C4|nr:hypothetical protein [Salinivibrio sp. AR640]